MQLNLKKHIKNNHSYLFMKPCEEYPNCLQATLASLSWKKSLQILPQAPPEHTSTRPTVSLLVEYGTILRSPLVQSKDV